MKPGDVVVCRFPGDAWNSRVALCLLVSLTGKTAVVRKSRGNSSLGRFRAGTWHWSVGRTIQASDVCRPATARELSLRHVIGGAAGEKLTGAGAGEVRR